jgi:predicted ester cyclase
MINDAVTAVRNAVDAINDRSIGDCGAELLDPSFVRHDLAELFRDSHGPAGASDFVSMIISAMPDFRLAIEDIFGTGDRAVVWLRMSGTHTGSPLLGQPARGRALSASAVCIYRVTDGRLAEAWQLVDGLAFYRLAGLIE